METFTNGFGIGPTTLGLMNSSPTLANANTLGALGEGPPVKSPPFT